MKYLIQAIFLPCLDGSLPELSSRSTPIFCYPRNYHPEQLLFFYYHGLCSSHLTISIVFHLLKMNPSDSLMTDSNISRTNTPANFANPSNSLGTDSNFARTKQILPLQLVITM